MGAPSHFVSHFVINFVVNFVPNLGSRAFFHHFVHHSHSVPASASKYDSESKSLPIPHNSERLSQPLALDDKFVRRRGVELEQVIVTRNHEPSTDVVSQILSLPAIEISSHAPLRPIAIDRQQREINAKCLK